MRRFAVLGLGRFGTTLALQLAAEGADVIAVDSRRDNVEAIADRVSSAVILDVTDERALRAHAVDSVDCAIVAIGEHFEALALATLHCKTFGIAYVVARGATPAECAILERIGADLVIQPEEETGRRIARQLAHPTLLSIQELAEGLSAAQIEAPRHFVGRTLGELDLRNRYGVSVVAIRPGGGAAPGKPTFPRFDTRISTGDILILVGLDDDVAHLTRCAEEG